MCDLGLVLGLASGAASAVAQMDAAQKNAELAVQQANLEYAANEREMNIETDAANKEGYKAKLEADRSRSEVITAGAGMKGLTIGERVSEQDRQGALNQMKADDAARNAKTNAIVGNKQSMLKAKNDIATNAVNPLSAIVGIATSGLNNYGAFK